MRRLAIGLLAAVAGLAASARRSPASAPTTRPCRSERAGAASDELAPVDVFEVSGLLDAIVADEIERGDRPGRRRRRPGPRPAGQLQARRRSSRRRDRARLAEQIARRRDPRRDLGRPVRRPRLRPARPAPRGRADVAGMAPGRPDRRLRSSARTRPTGPRRLRRGDRDASRTGTRRAIEDAASSAVS